MAEKSERNKGTYNTTFFLNVRQNLKKPLRSSQRQLRAILNNNHTRTSKINLGSTTKAPKIHTCIFATANPILTCIHERERERERAESHYKYTTSADIREQRGVDRGRGAKAARDVTLYIIQTVRVYVCACRSARADFSRARSRRGSD